MYLLSERGLIFYHQDAHSFAPRLPVTDLSRLAVDIDRAHTAVVLQNTNLIDDPPVTLACLYVHNSPSVLLAHDFRRAGGGGLGAGRPSLLVWGGGWLRVGERWGRPRRGGQ